MSEAKFGSMSQANALRARVGGGRLPSIDPAAIAKAEAALLSLSSNFGKWLQDEVDKLDAAREKVRAEGQTSAAMESLYLRAHDLKGLGSTYGFPLITRIAGIMCRLIDDPAKRNVAPMSLIDAHINAIKAAARDDIKTEDHPVGRALVSELETQVDRLGA